MQEAHLWEGNAEKLDELARHRLKYIIRQDTLFIIIINRKKRKKEDTETD